jgi:hypothetical protein
LKYCTHPVPFLYKNLFVVGTEILPCCKLPATNPKYPIYIAQDFNNWV